METYLEALGSPVIQNYDGKNTNTIDYLYDVDLFLQNMNSIENNNMHYSKVGNVYYLQGTYDFTSLTMDVLPETPISDGFLTCINELNELEILQFTGDDSNLTATSIGNKIINGFFITEI